MAVKIVYFSAAGLAPVELASQTGRPDTNPHMYGPQKNSVHFGRRAAEVAKSGTFFSLSLTYRSMRV